MEGAGRGRVRGGPPRVGRGCSPGLAMLQKGSSSTRRPPLCCSMRRSSRAPRTPHSELLARSRCVTEALPPSASHSRHSEETAAGQASGARGEHVMAATAARARTGAQVTQSCIGDRGADAPARQRPCLQSCALCGVGVGGRVPALTAAREDVFEHQLGQHAGRRGQVGGQYAEEVGLREGHTAVGAGHGSSGHSASQRLLCRTLRGARGVEETARAERGPAWGTGAMGVRYSTGLGNRTRGVPGRARRSPRPCSRTS
jgi:hypothetical protein